MLTKNKRNDIITIINKTLRILFTFLAIIAFLALFGIAFKSDADSITLTETFFQVAISTIAFIVFSKLSYTFSN